MYWVSERDRETFVKALLNPSTPNKALRKAAAWYKKTLGDVRKSNMRVLLTLIFCLCAFVACDGHETATPNRAPSLAVPVQPPEAGKESRANQDSPIKPRSPQTEDDKAPATYEDSDEDASTQPLPPTVVVDRWRRIGLTVEIPWRQSQFPGPDYTYISQCRGWVGTEGKSLFKTEIECEILGHPPDKATQYSVGLELWNEEYASEGNELALKAVDQIGVVPPEPVIEAFKNRQGIRHKNWEVQVDSSPKMFEITLYFRPR